MSYTFEVPSNNWLSDGEGDGVYRDYPFAVKVGEYSNRHIVTCSSHAIKFMRQWLGDQPRRIVPHKPIWTNNQYVAKIYSREKDFYEVIENIGLLSAKGFRCSSILDMWKDYDTGEFILITEYIIPSLDKDCLFETYRSQYEEILRRSKQLGLKIKSNPSKFAVKDGKVYII